MFVEDAGEAALAYIHDMQRQGWNSYIAMNTFTPGSSRRRKIDIKKVNAVYIEDRIDFAQITEDIKAGLVPEPSFVLRSSPGKYYVIWLVRDMSVEQCEAINRALQPRYNGDAKSVDAARVFRLPGTINLKYNPAPLVEIIREKGIAEFADRYTPSDFKIPYTVKPTIDHTADPDAQQIRASCYEKACTIAGVNVGEYSDKSFPDESSRDMELHEGTFKAVTGNSAMTVRFLNHEYFTFVAGFKLVMATNSRPRIIGNDPAVYARIKDIPMNQSFPLGDLRRIEKLKSLLMEERAGIAAWMVRGYKQFVELGGLCAPEEVRNLCDSPLPTDTGARC
jgi:RepB DNA-primase from phage plasmid